MFQTRRWLSRALKNEQKLIKGGRWGSARCGEEGSPGVGISSENIWWVWKTNCLVPENNVAGWGERNREVSRLRWDGLVQITLRAFSQSQEAQMPLKLRVLWSRRSLELPQSAAWKMNLKGKTRSRQTSSERSLLKYWRER